MVNYVHVPPINHGWVCSVCGRGVAPGEKTCDHGGTPAPIRHARDEWQRDYEAAPLSPCICPPNVVVCGNVACPRAPRVTCGAGVEYPVGQTGPVLGMS